MVARGSPAAPPCGGPVDLDDRPPPGLEHRAGDVFQDDAVLFRAPSVSRGSALHGAGQCVPCAWYWKAEGCRSGPECRRCHTCPAGELKARRKVKNSMLRGLSKQSAMPAPRLSLGFEDTDCNAAAEDEGPRSLVPAKVMMEPMLSSGSVLHYLGRCEPCAWFWRPGGCRSGQECRRCHLCPPGEVKARRRAKNLALKDILGKVTANGVAIDAT